MNYETKLYRFRKTIEGTQHFLSLTWNKKLYFGTWGKFLRQKAYFPGQSIMNFHFPGSVWILTKIKQVLEIFACNTVECFLSRLQQQERSGRLGIMNEPSRWEERASRMTVNHPVLIRMVHPPTPTQPPHSAWCRFVPPCNCTGDPFIAAATLSLPL